MTFKKIQAIAAAAAGAGSLQKQIEAFVSQARMLADGGLTLAEIGQLFLALITLAVTGAEQLVDAAGEDKKQAVLDAVGYLFDVIAPAIPLPFGLSLFRSWLTPRLRVFVLSLADGAIEAIVAQLPKPPAAPAIAA